MTNKKKPSSNASGSKAKARPALGFVKGRQLSSGDMKRKKADLKRAEGVRVSMAENKPHVLTRLQGLLDVGVRLGEDLLVGVNRVSKLVERTTLPPSRGRRSSKKTAESSTPEAADCNRRLLYDNEGIVVCLAKDVEPFNLHRHIIDICKLRKVPLVILPRLTQELSSTLKLRSATCFAVLSSKNSIIHSKILNESKSSRLKTGIVNNNNITSIEGASKNEDSTTALAPSQSLDEAILQSRIDSLFEFLYGIYETSISDAF